MLLTLLIDVIRQQDLQKRLRTEPDKVFHDYRITAADWDAVMNLPPSIGELLPANLYNIILALRQSDEPEELRWPGPELTVRAITPRAVAAGTPVILEISVGVLPTEAYDDRPFVVSFEFTGEAGERVVGTPVLPITLPKGQIAEVSIRCQVTFAAAGAYTGTVTFTKLLESPYSHSVNLGPSAIIVT